MCSMGYACSGTGLPAPPFDPGFCNTKTPDLLGWRHQMRSMLDPIMIFCNLPFRCAIVASDMKIESSFTELGAHRASIIGVE